MRRDDSDEIFYDSGSIPKTGLHLFQQKAPGQRPAFLPISAMSPAGCFLKNRQPGLFDAEKNFIYAGGGHTVLQFDDLEQARAFAKTITETVLRKWSGLELFVKIRPYDESLTPGENLKELSKALERKKRRCEKPLSGRRIWEWSY